MGLPTFRFVLNLRDDEIESVTLGFVDDRRKTKEKNTTDFDLLIFKPLSHSKCDNREPMESTFNLSALHNKIMSSTKNEWILGAWRLMRTPDKPTFDEGALVRKDDFVQYELKSLHQNFGEDFVHAIAKANQPDLSHVLEVSFFRNECNQCTVDPFQ
ncbi:hypothetical protein Cni_G13440 [Canna indica]|uniref:Uncharacterized protein n=1 Tax=Canna indica TaxID=4628 RepID=A0AAQ3KCK7_9LILI|nr:hypothetical protein Cni_G13440 [Canna indica]